jgi:hypothetical protein
VERAQDGQEGGKPMTGLDDDTRRARNREHNAKYRERHREIIRQRQLEWANRARAENHDAIRERERHWEQANRERRMAERRARRRANPEARRAAERRLYAANPEAMRERKRQWRRANPESVSATLKRWRAGNRETMYAQQSRRRHRRRVSMDRVDRLLSALYRRAIQGDPCYYCGATEGAFHVDHYVPLALGGTDHWYNLVHACAWCNQSKHATHGDDFITALAEATESAATAAGEAGTA